MAAVVSEVRRLISEGCPLTVLVAHLRAAESFTLSPLTFMRVVQEATGIHWTRTRELLAWFDPGMRLRGPAAEAEQRWRRLVDLA